MRKIDVSDQQCAEMNGQQMRYPFFPTLNSCATMFVLSGLVVLFVLQRYFFIVHEIVLDSMVQCAN